jgi:aspartate kinase
MKVFKFGGESVRDAAGVRNLHSIVQRYPHQELVIVVSAMGKITNALEGVLKAYSKEKKLEALLEQIDSYHRNIIRDLKLEESFMETHYRELLDDLHSRLNRPPSENYDYDYDQIVGFGELISTRIVAAYLQKQGLQVHWVDARQMIRTDNSYREAKVDWEKTEKLASKIWSELPAGKDGVRIMLTQGFIGHTRELNTTTLGREGSDFTAAILAYVLNAKDVTIWKDVPGVLNADPKFYKDTVMLKRISYKEAIELSYYGASVIHPKTIKPLQNKKIVLYVRSFQQPDEAGTTIDSSTFSDSLIPSFIFKTDQILISFIPRDFSFINEENLNELFGVFVKAGVKINLMQNSALNFSVCVDYREDRIQRILDHCREKYEVFYNHPCELVTIRHYDEETIKRLLIGKKVLVEQRSRSTARMVLGEG